MDLDVDDFGCVADGRFLEEVSISEGSAVLTALGGLRPVDVGKQVAVPGAADLVAVIADLADRQEVLAASMAAGSNQLTGTLVDPDRPGNPQPFREDLHVGRRITVAGAGPAGSVLLSAIDHVVDATTVILDDEAPTAVSGVEVIVNDPAQVGLSNYARRTLDGLLVDLGDRSVSDAAVSIGGRALVSATARFSSLDLGKTVTLRDAGLFVTTITSVNSSQQATLAAPAPRAVAGVAADVWRTDSRPGLTQLLGALASMDTEAAEIRFGPGVYDFTRIPPETHDPMHAAIGLRGLRNLTLRGSGAGATILRLMPNQDLHAPDTHVIETRDCRQLTLRDLSVHGAYLTMGDTNEQMHGINLNAGTQEMVIERVTVFQSAGDGIRLLGEEDNKVRKVWIDNCRLVQNKRTGIAFQRDSQFVWVRDCYIEMTPPSTDSSVDFEPSGNGAPTDIILDSNMIDHHTPTVAVSISGISGPDPARRVKFVNNVIRGGTVFCTDIDDLSIQDNTIVITDEPGGDRRIAVHVQRGGHGLAVTGNLLVSEHPAAPSMIVISEVNNRPVDRAMIAHNLCFSRAGSGIEIRSCEDVQVDGNLLVATGGCSQGIAVQASSVSDVSSISVRDNDITTEDAGSWDTGILIGGGKTLQHITVTGNAIGGASTGVQFQGGTLQQTPICALNRVRADVTTPLVGLTTLPERAIVVAGAASRGGNNPGQGAGRVLIGTGNPNDNQLAGNLGDIYQRVDPEPGPRLFVKEDDQTPGTGWTPK
jgi:Right handed beta helix region